ncbi:MAG TPA: hypothetical protein VI873_00350 [Candidatus Peribacteraceae bacterium]|nr:hypothetical protein [Candidatus Peribacteraceae bacterium]
MTEGIPFTTPIVRSNRMSPAQIQDLFRVDRKIPTQEIVDVARESAKELNVLEEQKEDSTS